MFDLGEPFANRRPLCHRADEPGWSSIVYWEIVFTRRFEYENQSSESDQNPGTRAIGEPKSGSGGLVWKPNSVIQIGSFFFERSLPLARAWSSTCSTRPSERIVASSAVGSRLSGPAGRVYGWWAKPPRPLMGLPPKNERRNASGLRFRLGPREGIPIGISSPNRIGSCVAPPRRRPVTAARTIDL